MNMALFAFLYPSKVAGLVLVDVYYADLYARIQELFPRYVTGLCRNLRSGAIFAAIGDAPEVLCDVFGIRKRLEKRTPSM